MTGSCPRDSVIALVGEGFGSLLVRSEFESHFLAADRPTFAQLDAYPHKSPKSLWRTRSEPVGRRPGSDWPDAVLSPTAGAARMG